MRTRVLCGVLALAIIAQTCASMIVFAAANDGVTVYDGDC